MKKTIILALVIGVAIATLMFVAKRQSIDGVPAIERPSSGNIPVWYLDSSHGAANRNEDALLQPTNK